MTAGVFKDPWVDCDTCGRTLIASQIGMRDGATITDLRRAARSRGWQTAIENILSADDEGIVRGPRLDRCGPCARTAA